MRGRANRRKAATSTFLVVEQLRLVPVKIPRFRVITHSRRGVFCGLDDFADACEAGRRHERIAFSKRPLRELSLPATTMTPDWRWKKLALREDDAPLSNSRGSAEILISRKFFADFRRVAGQVLLRVGRRLAFSAMPW